MDDSLNRTTGDWLRSVLLNTYYTPEVTAAVEVLREVLRSAEISPEAISQLAA